MQEKSESDRRGGDRAEGQEERDGEGYADCQEVAGRWPRAVKG